MKNLENPSDEFLEDLLEAFDRGLAEHMVLVLSGKVKKVRGAGSRNAMREVLKRLGESE